MSFEWGDNMKITRIKVHQLDIPVPGGPYKFSMDRSVEVIDHTFVVIETDEDVTDVGEFAPVTNLNLEQYAAGARTGIAEIAPALIGADLRKINVVYETMDRQLRGHPYAKSPIDMACWDILGKWIGLPLSELLGGRSGKGAPSFMSLSRNGAGQVGDDMAALRKHGVHHFQLKSGSRRPRRPRSSAQRRIACNTERSLSPTPTEAGVPIRRCRYSRVRPISPFISSSPVRPTRSAGP